MNVADLKLLISMVSPQLLPSVGGRSGELIKLVKQNLRENASDDLDDSIFEGKWKNQNMSNLKQRTKKVLTALLFMSPPRASSQFHKMKWKCRKLKVIGQIYSEYGLNKQAKKMFKEALKIAEPFGFSDLAYESSLALYAEASFRYDNREAEKYAKKSEYFMKAMQGESQMSILYYQSVIIINSNDTDQFNTVRDGLEKMAKINCTSRRFLQDFLVIKLGYCIVVNEFRTVINSVNKEIERLKRQVVYNRYFIITLLKYKVLAEISLGLHGEAEQSLNLILSSENVNKKNRENMIFIQAMNKLHLGDYQFVLEMYLEHRKSKFQLIADQWLILGSFLYFLNRVGELEIGSERFSIGKYLNETSGSNYDKKGGNVKILIGELLVYLVRDPDKFIRRIESVSHYNYKYLNTPSTVRSYLFIKILCAIPRAQFNPLKLKNKAKRYIDEMKTHPVNLGMNINIEIIPYEKLLDVILKYLDENRAEFVI